MFAIQSHSQMSNGQSKKSNQPSRFFLCTLSVQVHPNQPSKQDCEKILWIRGQKEIGAGGFVHWQFVVAVDEPMRPSALQKIWRTVHAERSRSEAATSYVYKEESSVAGTKFEEGQAPVKRNKKTDWDKVFNDAIEGKFDAIPRDILIRCYSTLNKIMIDYSKPVHRGDQIVNVFWGPPGTGKSHSAFEQAGESFYLKAPLTKWWDSYKGEEVVIIDEFRGSVDISHLLKWLDKYPCAAEKKGSTVFLNTKKWFITSNLHPKDWYPGLDKDTFDALMRRLNNVVHYLAPFDEMIKAGKVAQEKRKGKLPTSQPIVQATPMKIFDSIDDFSPDHLPSPEDPEERYRREDWIEENQEKLYELFKSQ